MAYTMASPAPFTSPAHFTPPEHSMPSGLKSASPVHQSDPYICKENQQACFERVTYPEPSRQYPYMPMCSPCQNENQTRMPENKRVRRIVLILLTFSALIISLVRPAQLSSKRKRPFSDSHGSHGGRDSNKENIAPFRSKRPRLGDLL